MGKFFKLAVSPRLANNASDKAFQLGLEALARGDKKAYLKYRRQTKLFGDYSVNKIRKVIKDFQKKHPGAVPILDHRKGY